MLRLPSARLATPSLPAFVVVLGLVAFPAAAAPAVGSAGAPVPLTVHDPLTRPAPAVELFAAPADPRPPEERVAGRLWQRLRESAPEDELAVVVHLHAAVPVVAEGEEDEARALRMAAAAHRFVARAGDLLAAPRALSHFPVVFGRVRAADVERLAGLPDVRRVDADSPVQGYRTEGAGLMRANILRSAAGGTGAGVGVAILDTGIDGLHPELGSRIVAQLDATGTTGQGTIDDHGHGTAVAGIVAGSAFGIARQARLWAIKVLDAANAGTVSTVLAGLEAVYAARDDLGGIHVVNMSLGGDGPYNGDCDGISPYDVLLDALHAEGIAVVVAAGNEGRLDGVADPACHSTTIAVGAVYDAGVGGASYSGVPGQGGSCQDTTTAADQIACYTNLGHPLDVFAPGHCATTTRPAGQSADCFGGTSAAAAYATGVAAQLLQLHPGTSPAALRDALATTGRPRSGVGGFTRNRIDAETANAALGGGSAGACVEDATTACLLDGRFRATVRFRLGFDDLPADASAFRKPVAGFSSPVFETELFTFGNAENVEILLKMLDQGNVDAAGQRTIAVLFGTATPLRIEITIVDTATGVERSWVSPFGTMQGVTDFTAFVK